MDICHLCLRKHHIDDCIVKPISIYKNKLSYVNEINNFDENVFFDKYCNENIYTYIEFDIGTLFIRIKTKEIMALLINSTMWGQYCPHCDDSPVYKHFVSNCKFIKYNSLF